MIPAVLTTRQRMQVEVDANTIFARPFDGFQEIPFESVQPIFTRLLSEKLTARMYGLKRAHYHESRQPRNLGEFGHN